MYRATIATSTVATVPPRPCMWVALAIAVCRVLGEGASLHTWRGEDQRFHNKVHTTPIPSSGLQFTSF
jgi:hypothetical protein